MPIHERRVTFIGAVDVTEEHRIQFETLIERIQCVYRETT